MRRGGEEAGTLREGISREGEEVGTRDGMRRGGERAGTLRDGMRRGGE
jgi:hypothetical protein